MMNIHKEPNFQHSYTEANNTNSQQRGVIELCSYKLNEHYSDKKADDEYSYQRGVMNIHTS